MPVYDWIRFIITVLRRKMNFNINLKYGHFGRLEDICCMLWVSKTLKVFYML